MKGNKEYWGIPNKIEHLKTSMNYRDLIKNIKKHERCTLLLIIVIIFNARRNCSMSITMNVSVGTIESL